MEEGRGRRRYEEELGDCGGVLIASNGECFFFDTHCTMHDQYICFACYRYDMELRD